MKEFVGYMAGVNLGGWISQYREAVKEHFDTFIVEEDISRIASWGMDHVRLPIDYMILEDDNNPFNYREEGFNYISNCIKWCEKYNLNIILDLHRAPGYAFYSLGENMLFEKDIMQNRFISLWKEFAVRFKSHGDNVVFELLNEIVEPDSSRWNKLSKKAIEGIRSIDKERIIIVGGNNYNSASTLRELDFIEDDRLVYTFHFYEPHIFTHQGASWEPLKDLEFEVPYPSGKDIYELYLKKPLEFKERYELYENSDKAYIRESLRPALDFARERAVTLYCGEYGVIDQAPIESSIRWHRDVSELLLEYNIGRAVWTYKLMNFSLLDSHFNVKDEELIKIVSKRK